MVRRCMLRRYLTGALVEVKGCINSAPPSSPRRGRRRGAARRGRGVPKSGRVRPVKAGTTTCASSTACRSSPRGRGSGDGQLHGQVGGDRPAGALRQGLDSPSTDAAAFLGRLPPPGRQDCSGRAEIGFSFRSNPGELRPGLRRAGPEHNDVFLSWGLPVLGVAVGPRACCAVQDGRAIGPTGNTDTPPPSPVAPIPAALLLKLVAQQQEESDASGRVVRLIGMAAATAGLASTGLVALTMAECSPSPTWWVKVTDAWEFPGADESGAGCCQRQGRQHPNTRSQLVVIGMVTELNLLLGRPEIVSAL